MFLQDLLTVKTLTIWQVTSAVDLGDKHMEEKKLSSSTSSGAQLSMKQGSTILLRMNLNESCALTPHMEPSNPWEQQQYLMNLSFKYYIVIA